MIADCKCSHWFAVMIGSAFRKVCIPYSVYMEAFKLDEPQRAVVPVLHAVFPLSVLTCSAVVGNPQRGIQELNPNKLEAIRGVVLIFLYLDNFYQFRHHLKK